MENPNPILRYNPKISIGLTDTQVNQRISLGLFNKDDSISSKSTSDIVKGNIFNLFNFINLALAIAIFFTGLYINLMFMGVVICNALISISQEIRAKKIVDKLNLISSNNAIVIRDSKRKKINIEEIVLDDIIYFENGNQIVTDSIILEGECEVNESLLTGESDLIYKKKGDTLLSGSFIVSGKCTCKVENVGKNNYVSEILKSSKYIKKTKSEIMTTLNKIIKIVSIAIIPMGALLFYRQLSASDFDLNSAIINTSAALIGMIPEGLILLTSSVLALGVLRLSKRKVLVQDIYSLETLARVDTLCLDKTGTITQGTFEFHQIIPFNEVSIYKINDAINNITASIDDNNETFKCIKNAFPPKSNTTKAEIVIPFSSEKKWSGIYKKEYGTFILGAAEIIFKNHIEEITDKIKIYSKNYRILAIAHSDEKFHSDDSLPDNLNLMAFILIKDKIRNNAEKTLNFFKKQGVDIKIISGDNPETVSSIAKRVGFENFEKYIDATKLDNNQKIKDAVDKYDIFGRVTPSQKQEIIKNLKNKGRTVAMVGDGVNDVLAMKESDCSVAMASGSDVARNVSHIVLLNSDFASMPRAVAEGRKSINNVQRSASIFLVKTIYSFILAILFFMIPAPYPFVPIQMTLISSVTIGIPSFLLALESNREKIKSNLFKNILNTSLPSSLTIVFSILFSVLIYFIFNLSYEKYSTINVVVTGIIGIILIYKISLPLNLFRKSLIWVISIIFYIGVVNFSNLFKLESLNFINIILISLITGISLIVYNFILRIKFEKFFKKFV